MKHFKPALLTLMLMFTSGMVLGEEADNLVLRDGVYYKKFTDVPFTGKLTGKTQGEIKSGLINGRWVQYWENGQLKEKGNYNDGKRQGPWVEYHSNGQLLRKGNYTNNKREGFWIKYDENGQLEQKGELIAGERDGVWIFGRATAFGPKKLLFKNGVQISD